MTPSIIVAILSLIGTLCGSFAGVIKSSKLTNFRLEQLEKKVDVHNNFASSMPRLEQKVEDWKDRIIELERKMLNK